MPVHVLLGGTGTLGTALTRLLLAEPDARIRVMARGEHRLASMSRELAGPRISYLVGDVRDEQRVRRALHGADTVYLMAALKHVETCEYNVLETVATNIDGAANVVRAAIDEGVRRAVLVSSDKAVEPTTTYGATKMVAERVFLHGNSYAGERDTAFSCVRYGNVLGSQGSVVEKWQRAGLAGDTIALSKPEITRFWWTIQQAARFVRRAVDIARAGDVLVPLMASCTLEQLAELVAPGAPRREVGCYATEKVHEQLLFPHELEKTTVVDERTLRVAYLYPAPPRRVRVGRCPSFLCQLC